MCWRYKYNYFIPTILFRVKCKQNSRRFREQTSAYLTQMRNVEIYPRWHAKNLACNRTVRFKDEIRARGDRHVSWTHERKEPERRKKALAKEGGEGEAWEEEKRRGKEEEEETEKEKRGEVKKTRASWRRIFAWVSLGGRRVCLVESAADLWPPPQALPLLSLLALPRPSRSGRALSLRAGFSRMQMLTRAYIRTHSRTHVHACVKARGRREDREGRGENRAHRGRITRAIILRVRGRPPVPPPPLPRHPRRPRPPSYTVSCLARFSSIFLPRRRRSSQRVERADDSFVA